MPPFFYVLFYFPSSVSSLLTLKSSSKDKDPKKFALKPEKDALPVKPIDQIKRKDDRKRLLLGGELKAKRINIPCDVCKQRYE